jgi:transposase InsO family protein
MSAVRDDTLTLLFLCCHPSLTRSRWVYVAFVVDAYARRILGSRTGTTMSTQLVLDAVE